LNSRFTYSEAQRHSGDFFDPPFPATQRISKKPHLIENKRLMRAMGGSIFRLYISYKSDIISNLKSVGIKLTLNKGFKFSRSV